MSSINLLLASLYMLTTVVLGLLVSRQHRWKVLLATCLLFYYLLAGEKLGIVLILSLITYIFSHLIHLKKSALWIAVPLLVIPLFVWKSMGAGNHFQNYQTLVVSPNWSSLFQIVGLSYFTFNSISYLIDIKRKYIEPERNFFFLLLYLIYFPAIFSGPLHRAKYLFEEFQNIEVTDQSLARGLRLILWGLFKNIVIAQRLFILMTQLQNSEIGGLYYLLVGLLFFLYLYCNFSSFVDFFQGVSAILSIRLKQNFKSRVYFSSSRQEFWQGWHITLNQWFRDYFFFALSGYDKKRRYVDLLLLLTFLLIALWHEVSTVMVIWGVLNGLWIIVEKKINFQAWQQKAFRKVGGVFYHLSIAAVLALIFISPRPAFLYEKIIAGPSRLPVNFVGQFLPSIIVILMCLGVMDYHYARAKGASIDEYIEKKPQVVRWIIYGKLIAIILIFGKSAGVENYYIQF
jgi:alginate O-acetyltransferase complex protein AlgI